MRNAREFVEEYRRKGYPDDRIRIIASMRPEPLRSEALAILDAESPQAAAPAKAEETQPAAQPAEPCQATGSGTSNAEADAAALSEAITSLKRQIATVRKERDEVATELSRAKAELETLRAENAKAAELRARAGEVESLRKELEETRAQRREIITAKAELEGRLAELQAALVSKETLLSEKDRILGETETALVRERTEREAATAKVGELMSALDDHVVRLRALAKVEEQLAEANDKLETLRKEAEALRDDLTSKEQRIADLEASSKQAQQEAAALREQLGSNEQALQELKGRLASRETELESLRAHFDHEAADLKKRAEQELWAIRRKLRRMRQMASIGGALAACALLALALGYISKSTEARSLRSELAAARERPSSATVAQTSTAPLPRPAVQQTPAPAGRAADAARPVPLATTISEPPQERPTPTRPAEQPQSQPQAGAQVRVITHVVQKNESLWIIAEKYLGKGEHWRQIARDNNISLTNPQLKQGMTLKITVPASR